MEDPIFSNTYAFLFLTTFRLGRNTFLLANPDPPPLPPSVKSLAGVSEDSLGLPLVIDDELSRLAVVVVDELLEVSAAALTAGVVFVDTGIFASLADIRCWSVFQRWVEVTISMF